MTVIININFNPLIVFISIEINLSIISGNNMKVWEIKPENKIINPAYNGISGKFSIENPQTVEEPPIIKESNQYHIGQ